MIGELMGQEATGAGYNQDVTAPVLLCGHWGRGSLVCSGLGAEEGISAVLSEDRRIF